jgi:hypothetical protein
MGYVQPELGLDLAQTKREYLISHVIIALYRLHENRGHIFNETSYTSILEPDILFWGKRKIPWLIQFPHFFLRTEAI